MKSIAFPDILSSLKVNVVSDHDAVMSNLKLLLRSDKMSLFGDPYYGTNLKRLIYNLNNIVLQDIVIDDIYVAILDFMPLIKVSRSDITVELIKDNLYCNIRCVNVTDYVTDMYTINLTNTEE